MRQTPLESFDAIRWIGERQPSLQRHLGPGSQPLLHFALMWNMFEGELCDSSASSAKLREVAVRLAERGLLAHPSAQAFRQFVEERYWDGEKVTERFAFLRLRSAAENVAVSGVLSGQIAESEGVIHALLLVVYRYRNNTFHGLKEVAEVLGSPELFDQGARFLGAALECA
ncbi:hypothetical protein [Paucibacter sp. KCTC 42545]|uniref:hypothetical protein n=1 Tax=Paucibacter sp. KCTC 42545 TaxID=1768242 RepID=UPI000733AA0A|nr:hypothetical protein [Paucibacter sp. KCTC 42545]ALT78962.1 hypothetical protein AT984_18970 [Paucibacter sp. KCTC 42545]